MSEETPRTDFEEEDNATFSDWGTGPSGWVNVEFARILERENNELRELVNLITAQEMSDSGRIFYPLYIGGCRCMALERAGQITEKYRKTPHMSTDEE